jgi:uncharacterized protein
VCRKAPGVRIPPHPPPYYNGQLGSRFKVKLKVFSGVYVAEASTFARLVSTNVPMVTSSKRKETILAVLAAGPRVPFTPVQIQKLLFLVDRRIPKLIGGPFFNFVPYHYGPFDKHIYALLEELKGEGYVKIEHDSNFRRNTYSLSDAGITKGKDHLSTFPPVAVDFVQKTIAFVLKSSFAQLVSAIYRAYPEMKANSVFA